jgi:hypothetical protein
LLDYPAELFPVIIFATFPQALLGILDREPGPIPVGLLGIGETAYFTEVSAHLQRSSSIPPVGLLPGDISGEWDLLDPAMNSSFLEGFNRRRLGVRESRFRAAFGKYPASATTGLDQQKFDNVLPDPVTNCRDLLTFAHLSDLRQSNALSHGPVDTPTGRNHGQTRSTSVCGTETHCHRVHEKNYPCLEHNLVLHMRVPNSA